MLATNYSAVEPITWSSMSEDEFAELEIATGAKLTKVGGVWWRQKRPFFYRPLLLYREFDPAQVEPPASTRFGGVQFAVTKQDAANSQFRLLLFRNPAEYSLASLSQTSRRHVRRAMERFDVRRIVDADTFVAQAHPVYCSFYGRTKYRYKNDRIERAHFAQWANTLFRFPKVQVLGAYRDERLVSVGISYLVEDVVFNATLFSHSDALAEYVSELILHTLRQQAAACEGARFIFGAVAGMERGLDDFYLRRGAELVSTPAQLTINPVVSLFLRHVWKNEYQKLNPTIAEDCHD